MKILKFGGKSLENKKKIEKIAHFLKNRAKKEKIVVVVSAMGDTTDKLINLASNFGSKSNSRELDMLLSCGELISASLLTMTMNKLKVKTICLSGVQAGVFARGEFGNGKIENVETKNILDKFLNYDCVIVAGFQARANRDDIITLGRGGSDATAVALGHALNAQVEIYSDFDGIYAGDPRRENYKKYEKIDFETADRFAGAGAKVLSKSSTEIALKNHVDVICKSSERPNKKGTRLVDEEVKFAGLNVVKDLCLINMIFKNCSEKMLKTTNFLLKNANFCEIFIKNEEIDILMEGKYLNFFEHNLAKLNKLLK